MKFEIASSRAAALVALITSVEAAKHGHGHHHRHHHHHQEIRSDLEVNATLEKKSPQCQFPTDVGLVSITPSAQNAGWAMSPNQPCLPGNYCPYACPPGQVSMQWDPAATSYTYPVSMNGGLYCDESGQIQKPFPNQPYCADGTGAVSAVNKASQPVSFCQTVLPGNEAMLIPTLVEEMTTLAVPGVSYWCQTAAQYYINAPGVSTEEGCVWGTLANPVGNWSPYTAGANTDSYGNTYVKVGWNPIYLQPTTPFRNVMPDWGISVECEGANCNGLPCSIDPSVNNVNEMIGNIFTGAGGAAGCVVTVPPGGKANIVVFEKGASGAASSVVPEPSSTSATTSSTSTPTPTETPTSTSTTTPTEAPTSTETPTPSSTSAASSSLSSTETSESTPTWTAMPTIGGLSRASPSMSYTYRPHVLAPSGSAEFYPASSTASAAFSPTSPSSTSAKNGAATATVSMLSLVLGSLAAIMAVNL